MNVFVILGVLFVALLIIVPLVEKSGLRVSDETAGKLSKIIFPLIVVALVVSMLTYFF